jgi:hypothetical protein
MAKIPKKVVGRLLEAAANQPAPSKELAAACNDALDFSDHPWRDTTRLRLA